ncbi:MAG: glycosyltransferase family 2 protein [Akkermansia muciniphila]
MQKPFFSIIIPAYNLENYIAATLQSVLVQTFQDFEIIIVDDGSSDETVSIIQSFHDPRIRLVSQVNGGVSRARNAGMKKAVGAYIAFLDGDDYWYPEHLELAADFFNHHPEILAYANRYMRDELEAIPPRPPSYPESIRRLGIRGVLFMNSSSVILNSSLASRLPPWEEAMPYGEDGLYWTRCMRGTGLIGLGGSVTSIYRQRASSAMHDEHYQHVSLHSLIAPLLNELEAMKNPKWQFAVHYLVIRELHPKRLLSLNAEGGFPTGRVGKIMHPCLNRRFWTPVSVFRKGRHGTVIFRAHGQNHVLLQMAGPPERMGRSLFSGCKPITEWGKHPDPARSRS